MTPNLHFCRPDQEGNPLVLEVRPGLISSKGRAPGRAWLVQIRRGSRGVVVTIGLSRLCADNLAEAISEFIAVAQIEDVASQAGGTR